MICLDFQKKKQNLFRKRLPDVVRVLMNEFPEGVSYHTHVHEYPEILFLLEGQSEYEINHRKYTVKKGQIVALNKCTLHAEYSTADHPVKVVTCVLDHVSLRGLEDNCLIPADACPVIDCDEYWNDIKNIFYELCRDNLEKQPFVYEIAQLNISKMIFYIHRLLNRASEENTKSVSELTMMVKRYIDENYSKDITLERLSEKFFVSPYHIAHTMKKELGMSPINYLINRRIGEAQRYLILTKYSINQIAELVGYENVNYFNRLFLKKTGYTPAKFRENGEKQKLQENDLK